MNRKRKNNKTGLILMIIGIIAVAVIAGIIIMNFKNGKTGGNNPAETGQKLLSEEEFEQDVIPYGDDESDNYDFTGDYFDTATQKGTMNITKDGKSYNITLTYSENEDVVTIWKMTAVYNPYRKAIAYRDCTRSDYTSATDSSIEPSEAYTDGSGFIYLSSKSLYWVDDKEDMGAGLIFRKVDENGFVDDAVNETDQESTESSEAVTEVPAQNTEAYESTEASESAETSENAGTSEETVETEEATE